MWRLGTTSSALADLGLRHLLPAAARGVAGSLATTLRPNSMATSLLTNFSGRSCSSFSSSNDSSPRIVYRDPIRQVFISQSDDIFTNLALEDWLFRNFDFDHQALLLLWKNSPCVVIGRHQNPWTEANVPHLRGSSTKLARRNSGGGTVFHDHGNLNCTFFTRRAEYDRRHNLEIVCAAIRSLSEDIEVAINDRDDIVVRGVSSDHDAKISGTAAKLGGDKAYHHCTVLVDVNACVLHECLYSHAVGVESKATQSLRVPVRNLREVDPSITVGSLLDAVGLQFLRTDVDGNVWGDDVVSGQRGYHMVRPSDSWFPGLSKIREDFESQEWIFGKTPKFKVRKSFGLPPYLILEDRPEGSQDRDGVNAPLETIEIEMEVLHGKVNEVVVRLESTGRPLVPSSSALQVALHGSTFGPDLHEQVRTKMAVQEPVKAYLAGCILEMVGEFA